MFRFKKNQKYLAYLVILFIPLFFLFGKISFPVSFQFKLAGLAAWPLKIIISPFEEFKKIISYRRTYKAYQNQKNQLDSLKTKLITLEELKSENIRFQNLLDLKRKFNYLSVAAHVIVRNPSYWNSSFIVDKGRADGVKLGQAVVVPLGIVGKITQVSSHRSKVILLTDPQFSVACMVQRSRENALVSGTLQGVCRLRYFNEEADIKVGDKIVTSSLSLSFPPGLLIGEITHGEKTARNQFLNYVVDPAVSLSQLEEVLIILK